MQFQLQTDRLLLRCFRASDFDSFLAYRNDPDVARYQGWSVPYGEQDARHFVETMQSYTRPEVGEHVQIAIEHRASQSLIGDVMCHIHRRDPRQATIGYTLARSWWGQGHALEAVHALLNYLFTTRDMHRVIADCDVDNTASWRLLERIGFRREAHFVESFLQDGRYTSEYHYGLLQREWKQLLRQGINPV
jgi:RimJ/RimL family protein N-acetyltransferase